MSIEFGRATTAAEIEAVQRLRFAVYVEEMGRYDDVAGGDEGRFAEPEDEHSWVSSRVTAPRWSPRPA